MQPYRAIIERAMIDAKEMVERLECGHDVVVPATMDKMKAKHRRCTFCMPIRRRLGDWEALLALQEYWHDVRLATMDADEMFQLGSMRARSLKELAEMVATLHEG